MDKLKNKKVAILATDGFEHSEFTEPKQALEAAGAEVEVISIKDGKIRSWKDGNWGEEFQVDKAVDRVNADDYRGLVLPGGVMNPDQLRTNEKAVNFVRNFVEKKKPIAAICHGPWTLVETGAIRGRKMTSYKSIQTDLKNAGVEWTDEEVVVDDGLVTSRHPGDLPAFTSKMIEEMMEGRHN